MTVLKVFPSHRTTATRERVQMHTSELCFFFVACAFLIFEHFGRFSLKNAPMQKCES